MQTGEKCSRFSVEICIIASNNSRHPPHSHEDNFGILREYLSYSRIKSSHTSIKSDINNDNISSSTLNWLQKLFWRKKEKAKQKFKNFISYSRINDIFYYSTYSFIYEIKFTINTDTEADSWHLSIVMWIRIKPFLLLWTFDWINKA